jgi:twitching motility protein PilT
VSLVDSLLTAIVRADGEALVMHVGERPHVFGRGGTVELSKRALTLEALAGMLGQLLPEDRQQHLDEEGVVEHEVSSVTGERFSVVAARNGTDVWVEIRRHRQKDSVDTGAPTPAYPPPFEEPTEPSGEKPVDREAEVTDASAGEPHEASAEAVGGAAMPIVDETAPSETAAETPVEATEPSRASDPMLFFDAEFAGTPADDAGDDFTSFNRLLKLAASKKASTMYIVAGASPVVRVDGEIIPIDGDGPFSATEVETLLLDLAPKSNRDDLRGGRTTEWIHELASVGPIRCICFRDRRGPGAVFRFLPSRAAGVDQLRLSHEIKALCAGRDGLVIVAGRRASGKSTLVSALVDLVNRTRSDYVIMLETQVRFVHESRLSFVSQREIRGGAGEMSKAARAALRENPDVLVLEDLRSPELAAIALEAADSGRLVIGAVTAPSCGTAIERIVEEFPPDERPRIQHTLGGMLRGVVFQVLVRRLGGGRVAARELLLNTSAVAGLIADGRLSQIQQAVDGGRRQGMLPLNDSLAALVRSGETDVEEACRQALDRDGLVALLKRSGIDTSAVERRT